MAQFTSADITKLMSQIPKGKSNAINAPDLAVRMGFSSSFCLDKARHTSRPSCRLT